MVDALKKDGCAVMLGIPTKWRTTKTGRRFPAGALSGIQLAQHARRRWIRSRDAKVSYCGRSSKPPRERE